MEQIIEVINNLIFKNRDNRQVISALMCILISIVVFLLTFYIDAKGTIEVVLNWVAYISSALSFLVGVYELTPFGRKRMGYASEIILHNKKRREERDIPIQISSIVKRFILRQLLILSVIAVVYITSLNLNLRIMLYGWVVLFIIDLLAVLYKSKFYNHKNRTK